jgi:hypothetical protein
MILQVTGRFSRNRLTFLRGLLLIAAGATLSAQESPSLEELLPGLKERAIIMDIVARIVEQDQEVVWDTENSRVTIPGRPVGLKLVGANIVVAVQFTPYFRRNGNNILVAQGQIWIDVPNQGISYYTTIQTIPLEFGEQIYFFPLGQTKPRDEMSHIEIQIVLYPYSEQDSPAEEGTNPENGGKESS